VGVPRLRCHGDGKHGRVAVTEKVKPPRSHWDMLMERRTVEDLEAVLAERLEVVKERRAMEARVIADVHNLRSA